MDETSHRRALVVGATGIGGQAVCRRLITEGWDTYGLSRHPRRSLAGTTPLEADLLDPDSVSEALSAVKPDTVFITTWMMQDSETENIKVNAAMVRNLLAALEKGESVRHVALMTGLKHYLGPFDNYATGVTAETPFREDEPRMSIPNFYYAQEDEVFAAADRMKFGWSVHRAHTIFGFAVGNAMNMVLTLSVYATICKELGQPFVFPGSETQWNGITDVTDGDVLADQMFWAATHPGGHNEPFNITNGDVFRWRWLWPRIAKFFGVDPVGFEGEPRTLVARMTEPEGIWRKIAEKHQLAEHDVNRLASWWHTDGDLGRNIECFADMTKSRKAGFDGFASSLDSFIDKVNRYREERIIP